MSFNCPNCSSESTQLLSIVYSSGVYTSEAVTQKASAARHTHTTVSVNQSALSRQAAPPEEMSVLDPIKFGFIAALCLPGLLTWLLPKGNIWEILVLVAFFGVIGMSLYSAYRRFMFNRTEWVTRMEEWHRQSVCLRCGAVFAPNTATAKNSN